MTAEREIVKRLQESRRARALAESQAQEEPTKNKKPQDPQEPQKRVDESVEAEEDTALQEGDDPEVCPDCGKSGDDCECDLDECNDSKKNLKEAYAQARGRAEKLYEGSNCKPYKSAEWPEGAYTVSDNPDDLDTIAENSGFKWSDDWECYIKELSGAHLQLIAGRSARQAELHGDFVFFLAFTGDPSEDGVPMSDSEAKKYLAQVKC